MNGEKIKAAMDGAVNYLLCSAREDGGWQDFHIDPPGYSDEWVTAYIGSCLLQLPCERNERMTAVLAGACRFLLDTMREDGGWGYNHRCRSDCDSTAHAVEFLARSQVPVDRKSMKLLCRFWKQDGGFTTYHQDSCGSWNESHIDVTLVTACLLRDVFYSNTQALGRLTQYVEQWFSRYELPPAFWWTGRYYTALAAVRFYMCYDMEFPYDRIAAACRRNPPTDTAFELALYAQLLTMLGESVTGMEIEAAFHRLLDLQQADGSFKGGKILRVTASVCSKPWETDDESQVLEQDVNSIYTTATAARALGSFLSYEKQEV